MMNYNSKLGMGDLVFQGLLLFITVSCSLFGIIGSAVMLVGMFFQIFVGIYQFLSGVVGAIKGSTWKRKYLIIAVFYILIGGGCSVFLLEEARWVESIGLVFGVLIVVAIPQLIAIGYFYLSYKDYQFFTKGGNGIIQEDDMNVLDQNIF